MNHRTVLATIVALSLTAGAAYAGGMAKVSVTRAPKHVIAGQAFELAFAVQPNWPMAKDRVIEPTVKAVCGKQEVTVAAVALKQNQYKASIVLPASGDWTITVDSHFCETKMKPLVLKAGAARGVQS